MKLSLAHLRWVHAETAHNPRAWYDCAETLWDSAKHLKAQLEAGYAADHLRKYGLMDAHYDSFGLLAGYALESILKGLWVASGGILVKDGKLNGVTGARDHDLLALARKTGVKLSAKERNVIDRLSYFVLSAGRYPVPRRAEEMATRAVPGRGRVARNYFDSDDWDTTVAVVRRLFSELRHKVFPFGCKRRSAS